MKRFTLDTAKRIDIEVSQETFSSYIEAFVQEGELRLKLSQANLLLIPQKGLLDDPDIIFFPSGTDDFLLFLEKHQQDGLATDICIDESNYKELTRNADLIYLTSIIVSQACTSIAADLVLEYLIRKLGSRRTETIVQWEVIIYSARVESGHRTAFHVYSPWWDREARKDDCHDPDQLYRRRDCRVGV